MKKMLQKLSSALLVVAVAGSCAFAQGQSNNYKPTITKSAAVKVETEPVKVQDPERDIYRATTTISTEGTKEKSVKDVKRPISNKQVVKSNAVASKPTANTVNTAATTKSTTIAHPNATRIDLDSAKPASAASKKRVSNVHKAKPANYKAPSNGTKTKEK